MGFFLQATKSMQNYLVCKELNLSIVCFQSELLILCFLISVLNCVRLLTRVLPYIFEDPDWRGFFWSTLPGQAEDNEVNQCLTSMLNILIL